jgi:ribosomal protein S18 acetylase RimI-like enzyme
VSYTISSPEDPTPASLQAARDLVARCNQHDGLDLPIVVAVDDDSALVLAHQGDDLIGVAGISRGVASEICLCVAPARRRCGVGRALLARALGIQPDASERILVLDNASAPGHAFAAALGARQLQAEHRLDLDLAALPPPPPPMTGLHIRPAEAGDAPALAGVIAAAFGDPLAVVGGFVARRIADPAHRFLIGTLAGRPVAAMRIVEEGGWIYLTTFGVVPELHGRGVGRRVLLHAIAELRAAGQERIRIEVEVDNLPAVGLYESCGFRRSATYAFMALPAGNRA